ncbi:hypothetical protein A3K24_01135 [candidate division Kazan bacterium RIFCSPHIGHO2_01_FULL_44_14]|uniref:WxL domain-containing protein n=1 Tax=candidate division Kazan bacterium RIFCSPLOWO2_01_FULL_45_19 TaxID=1798538 RepID=A0A1F4NPV9_UNCK3|nr:hypothetical protein [uncultured bacterium]OGB73450.1 MAG: hypothetical protein A3K51_01135 [candidate division Kazan bacterium RIFCSPLOWO2_01_FULL_45_19]OGB77695.1 MAG: hypothetical protein A3K24_01135 [candidate division Kazan bacterium RIFCSPHIGHO2_01_FULL_44_14]
MEVKAHKLIGREVEKARQTLVMGVVLFVLVTMSTSVFQSVMAANSGATTVSINVDAGTLDITQVPSTLNFGNGVPGANITGNTGATSGNAIIVSDSRGIEPGWTLKSYFNADWNDGFGTTMTIASKMYWYANNIKVNNNVGTDGDVQTGENNTFAGTGSDNSLTMAIAASGNGAGIFDIYNLKMEYDIPIDATPTSYTATMIVTVV